MKQGFWTHQSVLDFAKGSDPVVAILECARHAVLDAMEKGWSGPPFDPFQLAKFRSIAVLPKDDISDARLTTHEGRPTVEYNPLKPSTRIRYSVAHEVAHTLFDDYAAMVRYRRNRTSGGEDWQLEMLCNLAAAEFLMPLGTLREAESESFDIDRVLEWRRRYAVSTEAMLLRLLRVSKPGLAVFCSSADTRGNYHWDYVLRADGPVSQMYGQRVRPTSPITNCVAIGFTDKGQDQWPGSLGEMNVECVGIPAYPGSPHPRVVGFARARGERGERAASLKEVRGNALRPRATNKSLLVHVVNDKARSWGAGFGKQVAEKYAEAARRFRSAMESSSRPKLGDVFSTDISDQLTVVQLVAQSGYGTSETPRLRYVALQECLRQTREIAKRSNATVHMPPIGTGFGGAPWAFVKELIEEELVRQGVEVVVYRLRDEAQPSVPQPALF